MPNRLLHLKFGSLDRQNSALEAEKLVERMETGENLRFFTRCLFYWAISLFAEGELEQSKAVSRRVVAAGRKAFLGNWQRVVATPDGRIDPMYWRKRCNWYPEFVRVVPLAAALSDWNSAERLAMGIHDDAFPTVSGAKGEAAWMRALICYLRGDELDVIKDYLHRIEKQKLMRPKMLAPVLLGLVENDAEQYLASLYRYFEFFLKKEHRASNSDKIFSLDGTTLYHLGFRVGIAPELPEEIANHIIRFD